MNSVLLFDSNADGHHTDYLLHLINYWGLSFGHTENQLIVVAPQNFYDKYQKLYVNTPIKWTKNILFEAIAEHDLAYINAAGMIKRSFFEWNLVAKYEKTFKPTHIVLMYLDIFQLGILFGKRLKTDLSGIFFRPIPTTLHNNFKNFLNKKRKETLLKLVLKSHRLKNLFCLDESVVEKLKKLNNNLNISWLPDPVEKYQIDFQELDSLKTSLGILPNRLVLLLFGFLDNRKGIEQVIEALSLLQPFEQQRITLLMVGTIDPNYKQIVKEKLAKIQDSVQVITLFTGVFGREIQQYFDISDVILALYQQHIGSSSVVIRGVVSEKPILVTDFGYLGNFVKENKLGITVDSANCQEIAQKLQLFLTDDFKVSIENMEKIAQKNAAANYARIMFETILTNKLNS